MNVRRAPLLMTAAASGVLAAVAATPLVLHRQDSLEAVPAPPATATTAPTPDDLAARADQVTRDLDRPALDRVAAQQRLADAINANQQVLSDRAKAVADAKAAADKAAAAAAAKQAQSAGGRGSGSYSGAPRAVAQQIASAEFGWGAAQFQCYDQIIMRESEWNPAATNPSSGAYGIPQALPGSKMASAGSDWRTNPVTQIRWGLGYVKDRYGTPCQAWAFKSSHGWY